MVYQNQTWKRKQVNAVQPKHGEVLWWAANDFTNQKTRRFSASRYLLKDKHQVDTYKEEGKVKLSQASSHHRQQMFYSSLDVNVLIGSS